MNGLIVLNSHLYLNRPRTYQLIAPWVFFFFFGFLDDVGADLELPDSSQDSLVTVEDNHEFYEELCLRKLISKNFSTIHGKNRKEIKPGSPTCIAALDLSLCPPTCSFQLRKAIRSGAYANDPVS